MANKQEVDHSVSQEVWEKLLGKNNWEGLLEPELNLDLRKFILRCGDFCHVANDAFSGGTASFDDVNLPNAERYEIHNSLYATTHLNILEKVLHMPARILPPADGDHVPNWMGYCAATTDKVSAEIGRREIYIAWRGTKRLFEWQNNLRTDSVSARRLLRGFDKKRDGQKPRIMEGWRSIYTSTERAKRFHVETSARDQLKTAVKSLLERYKGEKEKVSIVVTGHSLGGVMATLSALDLAENIVGEDVPVAVVVFGCPKVGNEAFQKRVEQHPNLKILHVKNKKDVIPRLPVGKYVPVGTELVIDTRKLRKTVNPGVLHDLEPMLYTVAGWNGPDEALEKQVARSTDRLNQTTKSFLYIKSEIELWKERTKKMPKELLNKLGKKVSNFM